MAGGPPRRRPPIPSTASPRVVLIALDSMEIGVFDRLLGAGRLPNLARFAAGAARARVQSDGEFLHGSLWPTFATGTPPGEHGVYFWTQWYAEEMRHVRNNRDAFTISPFWADLPGAGQQAWVVDVPHVPAVPVPGVRTVAAWGLHDEMVPVSYPPGLLRQVRRRFGNHPLWFDTLEPYTPKQKLQMARELERGVAMRARLIRDVVARRTANLFVTTFSETHKAWHYLAAPEELAPGFSNEDAVQAVLQPLDEAWPGIMEAAGDDAHVFLFALHGIAWQEDYAHLGTQSLQLFNGGKPIDRDAHPDFIRRLRDLLPDATRQWLWRHAPPAIRNAREGQLATDPWDFAADRVFRVVHDKDAAVRVNLSGRERPGVVAAEAAAAVLDELDAFVRQWLTEDGIPAYTGLWRTAEHAQGARAARLPDALIRANPAVRATRRLTGSDGRVIESRRPAARNGVHTAEGFALYQGPRTLPPGGEVSPLDFAPTVLGLLGVPSTRELRGRNLFA